MSALAYKLAPVLAAGAAVLLLGGTTASAAAPSALPFLGPTGYKNLKLDMTEAQAVATGLLTDKQSMGSCFTYRFRPSEGTGSEYGDVTIGLNGKVHSIDATSRMLTREGVWRNMHLNDVKAVYPKLAQDPQQSYLYRTPVPGNSRANYTFTVNNNQNIATEFSLQNNEDPGCGA
ncbi:hypothetical protein [Crossiella cryophila]|uniref:Uncharacterized protein n=1 Tax=Crossiella cryophila TaxID=43355 RepID=A0A7W7C925_9PSEU|nr:hypothetical protein [Crossiella cryophila]MBB4676755.1 hypothetical protein [Crossiella cryophila]